jgi:MazG family protein
MSTAGARLDELVSIMATLRGPGGCPWDREQTLGSLRPFLLEETYEALDALDTGNLRGLCEELGDLLFEIVFLARIAEEDGAFTIGDAIDGVAAKLVRRHPHVFGDANRLAHADQVRGRWEELKAEERSGSGDRTKTLLSGVPAALPALLQAYELSSRAATVGFDWVAAADVVGKMEEEVAEIRGALADMTPARVEEEVGDFLFAAANLARKLGVEPEGALRRANAKFRERFTEVERRIEGRGERLRDKTLEQLEAEWQAVKDASYSNHEGHDATHDGHDEANRRRSTHDPSDAVLEQRRAKVDE